MSHFPHCPSIHLQMKSPSHLIWFIPTCQLKCFTTWVFSYKDIAPIIIWDQIANICWIIEKAREFQKNIYFCFINYAKAFDCVDHNKLENS